MKLAMTWLGAARVRGEMRPVEHPTCHRISSARGLSARSHCRERFLVDGAIDRESDGSAARAGAVICMRHYLAGSLAESKCI
jgi:hypothetical protein